MPNAEFLGRGFAFPPRVDQATGAFVMSEGEEDIRQAIYLIIMTRKGERAMLPDFGCNLHDYVFGLPDPAALGMMRREVVRALADWEPRVTDVAVDADLAGLVDGRVVLNVRYTVRDTNNPGNLVFPYYLYEGVGVE